MVTVILTSYNRSALLREAIESVMFQTAPYVELFVMDDDSSNPETHAVLDSYEGIPNVFIHRCKLNGVPRFSRVGYSVNINLALSLCRGDYITYLTCDDSYFPDRLERMVAHMEKHPDHKVIYGVQRVVHMKDAKVTGVVGLRDEGPVVTAAPCRIDHNSVMHRRECYEICLRDGPLWPTNPEVIGIGDAVVWQKFHDHGWNFHRVEGGPTDEHRLHFESIHGGAPL